MPHSRSTFRRTAATALLALFCSTAAPPAQARPPRSHHAATVPAADSVRLVAADAQGYGGQLDLPIGGSRILRFGRPLGRVMVGDPKVADVIPLSERTIYVLGKTAGASSLTIMPAGDGAQPIAAMDLRIGFDLEGLRRGLAQMVAGEPIEISAQGDGLVLTGTVSSSLIAARAAALADHYAPGKVINLMAVRAPEQVMLSVHVAEVQRSALRQLGLTNLIGAYDDTTAISLPSLTLNPDALASLGIRAAIGQNISLEGLFEALETHGYASTLAEPTLTALSGETAQFFAGGEFPVPVPQISNPGQSQLTIEYKPYGVSVGFTPTVYGQTINLVVAPEVSALDKANSVVLQGFRIPGITTRRAKTTVEMKNGQSFAIAGLIRRDFSDSLRGLPGASSLPVFGALFRSTGFQSNETEVVIIVTAHLAKPTDRRNLLLPTDTHVAPTGAELLLNGVTDKAKPAAQGAIQ
jgi:pilus assembly protein CpaC